MPKKQDKEAQLIAKALSRVDLSKQAYEMAVSQLETSMVPRVAESLVRNKTFYQYVLNGANHDEGMGGDVILRHCRLLSPTSSYGPNMTFELARRRFDWLVQKNFEVVANLIKEHEDVLLLKGAAMRLHLPEYKRFHHDVDIYVACTETAEALLARLQDEGFSLATDLLRGHGSHSGFLVAELSRHADNVDAVIGFHAGFYALGSIRYPAPLDMDLMRRSQWRPLGKSSLRVPCMEDMVVVLIAHVAKHGRLTYRDVNDLYMMTRSEDLDMDYIWSCLKRNSLEAVGQALFFETQNTYRASVQQVRITGKGRFVLACMRRGRRRSLTGGFLVQMVTFASAGRRSGNMRSAIAEILRLGCDLCLSRLVGRQSRLRIWNEKLWNWFLRSERRITAHAEMPTELLVSSHGKRLSGLSVGGKQGRSGAAVE
jgi:hypothetical protein